MTYKIEFAPVGEGNCSGDAIVFQYVDEKTIDRTVRTIVIDGGYSSTGEKLVEELEQWGVRHIDHIISTHPDNDHISGLQHLIQNFSVGSLWIHLPGNHAADIIDLFQSSRWQLENLERHLRSEYACSHDLAELAIGRGVTVKEPFQGQKIGPFTVLSPSLPMYRGLLTQFRATPDPDISALRRFGHLIEGLGRRVANDIRKIIPENWLIETLREGGMTSAENESSVVLYGQYDGTNFFLTADAGLKALNEAVNFGELVGLEFGTALRLFQVPHHGSRNNISPSILNRILGLPCLAGERNTIGCAISAGADDENHPRKVVTNALIRRGVRPQVTRSGGLVFANYNTNGTPVAVEQFANVVEQYD